MDIRAMAWWRNVRFSRSFLVLLWILVLADNGATKRNNILLRKPVKTYMKSLRDLASPSDKEILGVAANGNLVPKYMLELYERYKDRNVPSGNSMANTVRSINSVLGSVSSDNMFLVFNLTSFEEQEQLLNAEIHIFVKKRKINSNIVVTLHEIAPYYMSEIGRYKIDRSTVGWQVFPVSEAVKSCLSTKRKAPHGLALSFAKSNNLKSSVNLEKYQRRLVHLKGFLRQLSRPFLITYSNSDVNLTRDHVNSRIYNGGDNSFVNPESGKVEYFNKQTQQQKEKLQKQDAKTTKYNSIENAVDERKKTIIMSPGKQDKENYKGYKVQGQRVPPANSLSSHKAVISNERRTYKKDLLQRKLAQQRKTNEVIGRGKRSIHNNEIPEDPNEALDSDDNKNVLSKQLYKKAQNKQKSASLKNSNNVNRYKLYKSKQEQNSKNSNNRNKVFKMSDFDLSPAYDDQSLLDYYHKKSQYLPYSKAAYDSDSLTDKKQSKSSSSSSGSHSNTKNSKSTKDNTNLLPPLEEWGLSDSDSFLSRLLPDARNRNSKLCRKRKSLLDFADIGWSEWVIYPKSFESNYCSGGCPFPESQSVNSLSNHATLQSLVNMVGLDTDVPALCCVPARTTSLSVLYFDQFQNVVLKNYPDMSVQSCECR